MRVASLQPQDQAILFSAPTFSSLFYCSYGRRGAAGSQAFCLRWTQAVVGRRQSRRVPKHPVSFRPVPGGKKR
jgi:hypothetical protein